MSINAFGAKPVDASDWWTPGYDYSGGDRKSFTVAVPVAGGPFVTADGVTLTGGRRVNLAYPSDQTSGATFDAAEALKANYIGEVGSESSEVIRYTSNGSIDDVDHWAIADSPATTLTLPPSTPNRVIAFSRTTDATVTISGGAEEFHSAAGSSVDQSLEINEKLKIGTLVGRGSGGGWDVYEGAASGTASASTTTDWFPGDNIEYIVPDLFANGKQVYGRSFVRTLNLGDGNSLTLATGVDQLIDFKGTINQDYSGDTLNQGSQTQSAYFWDIRRNTSGLVDLNARGGGALDGNRFQRFAIWYTKN